MFPYFYVFVGLLLQHASAQMLEDQYMLCKSITRSFEAAQNQTDHVTNAINNIRQGKRGPVGPPGPPGVVDYDHLSEVIREEIQDIRRNLQCFDGVAVDRTCYRLVYRVGYRMSYNDARALCNLHSGLVAEIPDERTYNAVFQYIQRSWSLDVSDKDSSYVDVWLGSDAFLNGEVMLTNGSAGYTNWYPDYPSGNRDHNRLAMDVPTKPGLPLERRGMFNINPEYLSVPLCQYPLQ